MYTFTEENYLKAIHHLSGEYRNGVNTNAIAERLNTRASTVTDMLRKLSEKDLLIYKKYQGARLTNKGKDVAVNTVRKHRLWEVFLVNQLEFGWEEVHEIAEQLEHIQSVQLTDKLDAFLGHPKYDPHGDPIPDKNGVYPSRTEKTLFECDPGAQLLVKGVKDTSSEFLKYLKKVGISLGEEISIIEKEKYDNSMKVSIGKQPQISLSHQVCINIYVTVL